MPEEGERMEVKCPKCGRFLAEAAGYVRVICRDCVPGEVDAWCIRGITLVDADGAESVCYGPKAEAVILICALFPSVTPQQATDIYLALRSDGHRAAIEEASALARRLTRIRSLV